MPVSGLFFEANSIQSYILLGGRLRDVVGASNLIDELCGGTLDRVLNTLGLKVGRDCTFVRRAAGAFYAVFEADSTQNALHAQTLAAAWSATVRHVCPGLGFNLAVAQGDTVFDCVRAGTAALAHSKAQPVLPFPVANPLVERAPRTGLPAVAHSKVLGAPEFADAAVMARRQGYGRSKGDKVGDRLLNDLPKSNHKHSWRFPRNLEHDPREPGDMDPAIFPFTSESRYLAVIHADANGLGQQLISLIDRAKELNAKGDAKAAAQYKALLPKLSEAIENSMVSATVSAIEATLLPAATSATLPARPLVLAGDDLSILVRADLALPFMHHLLNTFEETSAQKICLLAKNPDFKDFADLLKTGLTACAGIVFVKNNHPFTHALHIAEDLCGQAKKEAKNLSRRSGDAPGVTTAASAIAMHRLTESLQGEASVKLPRVKAWGLGKHCEGLPQLSALMQLAQQAATIAHGPLRRLLSTVELSPDEANEDYRRWRIVMDKTSKETLIALDEALSNVLPGGEAQSNFRIGTHNGDSVLPDLIDMLTIGQPPAQAKIEGYAV